MTMHYSSTELELLNCQLEAQNRCLIKEVDRISLIYLTYHLIQHVEVHNSSLLMRKVV